MGYESFINHMKRGFKKAYHKSKNVHSIYLTGSYAQRDYIYSISDVDLVIIFTEELDDSEIDYELEKFENVLSIFDLRFDITVKKLQEMKLALNGHSRESSVLLWAIRKIGVLLFGNATLLAQNDPPFSKYLEDIRETPMVFMEKIRETDHLPEMLEYPDFRKIGLGYFNTRETGECSTKTLYSLCSWIATSLFCHETGLYISCGRAAIKSWSPSSESEFHGLSEAIKLMREKWRYRVPNKYEDKEKLLKICQNALRWEREYISFAIKNRNHHIE